MNKTVSTVPSRNIESTIVFLRGQKVILASDLAEIYCVPVKRLIEQVMRNIDRFPDDFMFQLSREETKVLEHIPSVRAWGGRRKLPFAFTEHGAVMAANVLRSKRAVAASIYVVRAFVRLRQFVASHKELADKLADLERQVGTHDKAIVSMFQAIRKLMAPLPQKKKKGGYIQ